MSRQRAASLYRLYDDAGSLLYVGISMTPIARLAAHRSDKTWWTNVGRIEIASFDSPAQARAAESRAIAEEQPMYNLQPGSGGQDELAADPSLRGQLVTAGVQVTRWTARRDEMVRQASAAGLSLRAIGEAVGLSHTAIAKLLAR